MEINSQLQTSSTSSVLDQQRLGAEIQELRNPSVASNLSFQTRLIRFITVYHASFEMITNEYFRCLFLSPTVIQNDTTSHIPTSHNTLRTWIEKDFEKAKNKLKTLL